MNDIYEFDEFIYWNFFSYSSFFIVIIIFLLFIIFEKIIKKQKKQVSEINDFLPTEINFLEELEKINWNYLEKYLSIYSKFLEEKTWIKNLSNLNFSEIKLLNIDEGEKKFFEKIYFKKYSKNQVSDIEIDKIYEELKLILKK